MDTIRWDEQTRLRFNELRLKQLSSILTDAESAELQQLMNTLLAADEEYLTPAISRLQQDIQQLQSQLQNQQVHNTALAQLLLQQEQLAADAQQSLRTLEQRQLYIHQQYTRLTGDSLTVG